MGALRDLLDANEPLFSKTIERLEKTSGESGRDGRLIAEIASKVRAATTDLKLDPTDTSLAELYEALMVRVEHDNRRLASDIGGRDPDDTADMVPRILKAVTTLHVPKKVWVLKHDVAKRLMRQLPPRRLMKEFKYDTVDLLLQNEPIEELYIAIRFSEPDNWMQEHIARFDTLTPDDFEMRDIAFLALNEKRYVTLATPYVFEKLHNVTHSKELGVVGVLPTDTLVRPKGFTFLTMALLLHYLNEVRMYSAFFRLQRDSKRFGDVIANTLAYDPTDTVEIAGAGVHWRVVQRYFGKHGDMRSHPELSSPHVHPEDIIWRRAEKMLMIIEPSMSFWDDMDYVGVFAKGTTVSFNVVDAVLNYAYSRPLGDSYAYHFRESLWNELFSRYLGAKTLQEQILLQLESRDISLDEL